jgi:predicted metal-dependent hydrolase
LIRLPEELSDYVIIHELVHTIHKNHGPHFWDLLEKTAGNAKEKANQLKKFHLHDFF